MTELETLHIERLAYGGDGVAHLADGRVAFVRGSATGDVAQVRVTESHDRFVRGVIESLVEPSPDRVPAPCPYFEACGGCQWQHIAYDAQLAAKREALVDALSRIGGLSDAHELVADTIASPKQYGYRNKVELSAETVKGRLRVGFARAGSDEIVEIDRCLLLPERASKLPKSVAGALRYVQGAQDLGIQRVGLRVAVNTRDVEAAIWTAPGPFPRQIVADTLHAGAKTTSVVRVLVKESRGRRTSGVEVLGGKGFWRERMLGMTYAISAPSFFQVNTHAAELLVRAAIEALVPSESDRVLDLFAGAGTFTLPLAARAGDVVAVEAEGSAVRDLRRNLEHEGLWAEVLGGDAARELPGLGDVDLALVDPPRAGLAAETVTELAGAGARSIAYVSCDPPTLARDAKRLAESGYALRRAVPFDLFPQTWHVETLALFERV